MIELDLLAQRYSKLPSEIKDAKITDYQFDALCATIGIENEVRLAKRREAEAKAKRGRR